MRLCLAYGRAEIACELPEGARIAVLPQGPYVLATVRGARRSLGQAA